MHRGNTSSPFRGSWRGATPRPGAWRRQGTGIAEHQGKDQVTKEQVNERPLGRLITQITLDDISGRDVPAEDAKITDCRYAASYSLIDSRLPAIIIPGQPAVWNPSQLPSRLLADHGDYLRDQNGARFPEHPMQASVQSLFALNEEFDPSGIDIMGCASSLGDILRFVRSIESTFRSDVEMVGDTLFIVRNHRDELIPDVRGYGHSFLEAFTSYEPQVRETKSHQRIVSYLFGGLRCLVRFECDGHFKNDTGGTTAATSRQETANIPEHPLSSSIAVKKAGTVVPQESILEIKTKSQIRGPIEMGDHLPRLWLRQIPNLVTAYHNRGIFEEVQKMAVRQSILSWETEHKSELRRFASILRQLIIEVKRAGHLKLELCRTSMGPLELREQSGKAREVLPNYWKDMWTEDFHQVLESDGAHLSDEDDDRSYPPSSPQSDEYYRSDDDFALDYTACSLECGYCGRCDY
ncbi:hypothetical protein AAE478_001599 [Parahypoxylon ruwenzoriense]